ncbi:MAG TPA: FtsX-like permease family protein [Dinghuibacter sp.]|uniref:ABC transporter permease n=1 Tax=Dinghuibacter sp. TaxID=2024697 RepID=UPI002C07EE0A|nr:FtsX-like permease family protein [Dinghuibacter sp.]HTJ13717.1 FtsX-like permease family protein [Dinghuibacter sp.]
MLVSFLAGMLAIGLTALCLPYFNLLTGKDMALTWEMAGALITTAVLAGLISGSYPALYFSNVSPIQAFKAQSARVRQTLVVIQFTITIALALGTVVVYRQVRYAQRRPVGYTRGGLIRVTMNTADMYGLSYNALRSGLLATGAVTDMAESSIPSTTAPTLDNDFSWEGKPPGYIPQMGVVGVTFDYGRTMQWQIREGRGFDRSFPSDTGGVVINEAAQRLMGFRVPTGKIIYIGGTPRVVLGVVRDMVMGSPYAPVQPTIFSLWKEGLNAMVVRLNPAMPLAAAIDRAARVFRKFNPEAPFDYHFVDDEYAQKFMDEERSSRLVALFAGFALFISCMGLFGLASFMTEQRTREIAVRRVLGADVRHLWALLAGGFARLVVIACTIAIPLSYWVMRHWLRQYAYKAPLAWWVFILIPAATLLLAVATVSYQTLKAALTKPSAGLKADA